MTILIVDDEPAVLRLLATVVQSAGYEALKADTGGEALAFCESTDCCIDLVISDVVMPRTDGRALAECMNRKYPGVPIIFVSGYPQSRQLIDGLTARGFLQDYTFVEKPFSAEALLKVIRKVLRPAAKGAASTP